MTEHPLLFEIVQKVFNAGQKFRIDTDLAIINGRKFPAAYPVITPLIEELVECFEECMKFTVTPEEFLLLQAIAKINPFDPERSQKERALLDAALGKWRVDMALGRNDPNEPVEIIVKKPVRPSSPFRSVEIVDGELK